MPPYGSGALQVSPDVIELLGSDTLVFLRTGGSELVARLSPKDIGGRPETVGLHLDIDRARLFDAQPERPSADAGRPHRCEERSVGGSWRDGSSASATPSWS